MIIESPPILSGEDAQKLEQMYRYLQRMSDELEKALNNLTADNFVPEIRMAITTGTAEEATKTDLAQQSSTLKSIIIKTADIIRSEQDEIRTTLESHYQALSNQFGAYERDLTNNITATAEGIIQEYQFVERIQALDDDTAELKEYKTSTSQYIKSGLLDDTGDPVFGVEVGNAMDTDNPQNARGLPVTGCLFFE